MSKTMTGNETPLQSEGMVEKVRERYGRIAQEGTSCCGGACGPEAPIGAGVSGKIGYGGPELEVVPEGADLGLGCGAPIGHLDLQPGETVLDLGSGAGMDVFLAAPLVGQQGRVIGVDMTEEMLERARRNAERAGYPQVEFRQGRLEQLPVEDASVDAVTSNCVINLVPDKGRVFAEVARVLRPGGRLVISDMVLDGELPEAVRNDLLAYVGCVSGALGRQEYFELVAAAGLRDVEVLADADYLEMVGGQLPRELEQLLEGAGVEKDSLRGVVRSVTFRARR